MSLFLQDDFAESSYKTFNTTKKKPPQKKTKAMKEMEKVAALTAKAKADMAAREMKLRKACLIPALALHKKKRAKVHTSYNVSIHVISYVSLLPLL